MITAKEWKGWLNTLGYPQRERAPRRKPFGLAAMHGSISCPKLGHIRVISRNGLYLETSERWPIGEVVWLTLQKECANAAGSELQIDVQARVASLGEDGVGLGFVLPQGLNAGLWEHLVATADCAEESEDTQFIFRMVRAILFLYRLCPSSASEPIQLITGEPDEFRTRSMLAITLAADRMLSSECDAENMHSDSYLVSSILKDGSWAQDELTQKLWAGLLVSSCSFAGADDSSQKFQELLLQVTPHQAHILVEACRRAIEFGGGDESHFAPLVITPEDMIRITGIYDLYRSSTEVAKLHNCGLVASSFDFSTHSPRTCFDITPTPLGMRLFKVCRGQLLTQTSVLS